MGGNEGAGGGGGGTVSQSILLHHVSLCEVDAGSAQSASHDNREYERDKNIECFEKRKHYTPQHRDATHTSMVGGQCAAMANG
jgi:hypothetical protein